MKNSILTILVISLGFSTALAQPAKTRKRTLDGSAEADIRTSARAPKRQRFVSLVPTVGGGFGWYDMPGFATDSGQVSSLNLPAASLVAGPLVEFNFGRLALQTGVLYLREGTKFRLTSVSPDPGYASGEFQLVAEHIGLPLLAKLTAQTPGGLKVSLKGGVVPAYAVGVSGESSYNSVRSDGTVERGTNSFWAKEGMRAVNVFGLVGAGLEFDLGGGNDLRTELVYDRSILSLNQMNDVTKIYSQSVMLMLGMGIGL